jgi:nucleoside diphosphate kinase
VEEFKELSQFESEQAAARAFFATHREKIINQEVIKTYDVSYYYIVILLEGDEPLKVLAKLET